MQPIQLVIVVGMIVMILIMVWQTFLLRYGLLGILFKEFLVSFLIVIFVTGSPSSTQRSASQKGLSGLSM